MIIKKYLRIKPQGNVELNLSGYHLNKKKRCDVEMYVSKRNICLSIDINQNQKVGERKDIHTPHCMILPEMYPP